MLTDLNNVQQSNISDIHEPRIPLDIPEWPELL